MSTDTPITGREVLPVMEAFYTIQGEGFHQGKAAWFIRLGGCDVGCHWCDVKDSWDASQHPSHSIDAIANDAAQHAAKVVVVTGGEPLMYDLTALTQALHDKGLQTHIETSGAYPLTGSWDWITVSPKKFKPPLPSVLEKANELKVVVFNRSDFDWAEQHAQQVGPQCLLYLQPEWDQMSKMVPSMVAYVQAHPQWQLSLQVHKWIGVE